MIGWMLENTSSSGTRGIAHEVALGDDQAVVQRASEARPGRPGRPGPRDQALDGPGDGAHDRPSLGRPAAAVVGRLRLGGVTGERQEHVVERRPMQATSSSATPAASRSRIASTQAGARRSPRRRTATARRARPSARPRRPARRTSTAARRAGRGRARRPPAARPPTWAFSSSAVPWAMIRPASTTAMRSASWSASSRYCVVSSSVVPPRTSVVDHVPHVQPAARVEPGGRLVEEQHRRPGDQAGARSSRRRMPPEYVFTGRFAASVSRTARAARRRAPSTARLPRW